jgi:hypothetical protein
MIKVFSDLLLGDNPLLIAVALAISPSPIWELGVKFGKDITATDGAD